MERPFSDVSDEAQRALAALVEVATNAKEFEFAREISEAAVEALEAEPDDCQPQTLVAMARMRALLALETGQPDDAEDAWDVAFEKLESMIADGAEEHFYKAVQSCQARCHEFRAENRFRGGAVQLAEIDLKDAYHLYKEAGLSPEDVERLRLKLISASS